MGLLDDLIWLTLGQLLIGCMRSIKLEWAADTIEALWVITYDVYINFVSFLFTCCGFATGVAAFLTSASLLAPYFDSNDKTRFALLSINWGVYAAWMLMCVRSVETMALSDSKGPSSPTLSPLLRFMLPRGIEVAQFNVQAVPTPASTVIHPITLPTDSKTVKRRKKAQRRLARAQADLVTARADLATAQAPPDHAHRLAQLEMHFSECKSIDDAAGREAMDDRRRARLGLVVLGVGGLLLFG